MSTQRIVRQIEISVLIHATEDREKVIKAVSNLFPSNLEFPNYVESNLDGYFGDPITSLYFLIKNREPANELFNHLISNLSSLDYVMLMNELPQRMDETKNLYLRFDKQKAYLRKISLERHDSIRFKISLNIPHKADPEEVLKSYLEEIRI